MAADANRGGSSPSLWVILLVGVITAMLVRAGVSTGDWRGVVVTEVQVLVVACVTYLGLRPAR